MPDGLVTTVALGFSAPLASITEADVRSHLDPVFGQGDNGLFYTEDGNLIGTYVIGVNHPVERIGTILNVVVGATKLTDGVIWAALYAEDKDSPTNFLVRTALDRDFREVDILTFSALAKAAIGV